MEHLEEYSMSHGRRWTDECIFLSSVGTTSMEDKVVASPKCNTCVAQPNTSTSVILVITSNRKVLSLLLKHSRKTTLLKTKHFNSKVLRW